jgi:hypothetical protein
MRDPTIIFTDRNVSSSGLQGLPVLVELLGAEAAVTALNIDPWVVMVAPQRLSERIGVMVELMGDDAVAAVERHPEVRTPV